MSNQTIGYLTAYVIIVNLLGLFNFSSFLLSPQFISFATTGLSILILVFSQIEASFEYNLKAEKYHDCAKAIGKLYLQLRDIMLSKTKSDQDKEDQYNGIAKDYAKIIERFDNHASIDFQSFKAEYHKDFGLGNLDRGYVFLKQYFVTDFLYHFLIAGPIVFAIFYVLK